MKKAFALAGLLVLVALLYGFLNYKGQASPIRIGVIYSQTGTMAESEKALLEAVKMAVEEINAAGGVLGRKVEVLAVDGKSDPKVSAAEAERLITQEKVSMLIACWTSACREAVKPIVEKYNHLMFYPLQYEGLETCPNIVYTGMIPNQQLIPGVQWMLDKGAKRLYLIGSDYIFPRTANVIIRDVINLRQGVITGERYLPLGATDFKAVAEEIRRLKPDAILNTINGDSNRHFFRALKAAGLQDIPTMSFSVSEADMKMMEGDTFTSHYVVWSYLQGIDSDENRRFIARYKSHFGRDKIASDPLEATYIAVYLWAQAVRDANSDLPERVNRTILRQAFKAPSGMVSVDYATRHLWKSVRIGKVNRDGLFEKVWESPATVRPSPFPELRGKAEWLKIKPQEHSEGGK